MKVVHTEDLPHLYASGKRKPVITILSANILPVLGMTCQCSVKLKSLPLRLLPYKHREGRKFINHGKKRRAPGGL